MRFNVLRSSLSKSLIRFRRSSASLSVIFLSLRASIRRCGETGDEADDDRLEQSANPRTTPQNRFFLSYLFSTESLSRLPSRRRRVPKWPCIRIVQVLGIDISRSFRIKSIEHLTGETSSRHVCSLVWQASFFFFFRENFV